MGFYHVAHCGAMVIDCHLITALVERWRPETHTFHFPIREATVTLQDVAIIWGLHIDGPPLSIDEHHYTVDEWSWYCFEFLGFTSLDTDYKSKTRIRLSAINSKKTSIGGAVSLLQVWAWSRIPAIQPTNRGDRLLQTSLEGFTGRNLGLPPYGSRGRDHCEDKGTAIRGESEGRVYYLSLASRGSSSPTLWSRLLPGRVD
ncbi:hypothetical protein ACS0TY_033669 [Phlomoides rotata]